MGVPFLKTGGNMQKSFHTLKLSEIHPYPNNPRINDTAVADVIESIKQCGNCDPIEIDEDNIILSGHTRLKALQKLGYTETECVRYTGMTEEQKKKYRLLANKTGEKAEWDIDLLEEELKGLDFGDFDFGFDIDIENEPTEIVEDDVPDVPQESKTKLGDLWKLGNHRLICGDSADVAVIDRLMDGVKAKLLLTDPPYGVKAVESGGHNDGKKAGKQMCRDNVYMPVIGDDTTDTARANYDVALTCTENQIIFGGNYFTDFLPPSRCWIVWDKKVAGSFADGELAWTSFDRNLKIYEFMWSGMRRQGDRTVEGKTRVHPTQKPVGMLADILKDFSEENDSILDCFGGSGSTLIACEQLNRKCYMAELDPRYVSVIVQRWLNLTGRKDEIFCIRDGQRLTYDEVFGE